MLNESSQIDDVSVAECFIKKHKNFLKLYTIYCQNYKQTHDAIEQMEREHHLDKSIERVRLKYGHALKMGTYYNCLYCASPNIICFYRAISN